ncbi:MULTISPECIES: phosphodiester glycosidase family protein [unclassified Rhizobium]|uniref:phosphodiester glycosidase family protein n=1 Tax=unclassified Rhizobium TaxID=2613769 RepID=UPI001FFE294A|nr:MULTISPECIES: phosphodiester glycosidase family protein [unclassified Rhizobium]
MMNTIRGEGANDALLRLPLSKHKSATSVLQTPYPVSAEEYPLKYKLPLAIAASAIVFLGVGIGYIWDRNGAYGFNTILRRGGTYWITIEKDDPRLSPSMRLALQENPPIGIAGAYEWREVEPGYEVAEMPVIADGKEADRVLLNRIDPTRFKFIARNAPAGDKGIDEWEKALPNAVLIVNGSYFDLHALPDTPIISEGVAMGPTTYDAKAGAFVASDGTADIKELADQPWQTAISGSTNAMVSYPLLIGTDGQTHVPTTSKWLANRTFVGKDGAGRIIVGTTKEAFFPLATLAKFLKSSQLDLKVALNFDGGPIACQSVRLNGFARKFYAKWESQWHEDKVTLLRWPFPNASWAMPMILEVERR